MKPDWKRLSELLQQECRETPFAYVPYHRGLYDLAFEVARTARDAEPGEAERRIYAMLSDTLRGERAKAVGA